MAKMIRKFLKMESGAASFIDVGKLLKRSAPENLEVFFSSVNLEFGI